MHKNDITYTGRFATDLDQQGVAVNAQKLELSFMYIDVSVIMPLSPLLNVS